MSKVDETVTFGVAFEGQAAMDFSTLNIKIKEVKNINKKNLVTIFLNKIMFTVI